MLARDRSGRPGEGYRQILALSLPPVNYTALPDFFRAKPSVRRYFFAEVTGSLVAKDGIGFESFAVSRLRGKFRRSCA